MKTLAAAALAALMLAGCATLGASDGQDDALVIECRLKADEYYKARYTPAWDAAVKQCIEERTGK